MEATYIGIKMWAQAVEKAKSTDTDKVIAAMAGQTFKARVQNRSDAQRNVRNQALHRGPTCG